LRLRFERLFEKEKKKECAFIGENQKICKDTKTNNITYDQINATQLYARVREYHRFYVATEIEDLYNIYVLVYVLKVDMRFKGVSMGMTSDRKEWKKKTYCAYRT
jgi:hypothetical protein